MQWVERHLSYKREKKAKKEESRNQAVITLIKFTVTHRHLKTHSNTKFTGTQ